MAQLTFWEGGGTPGGRRARGQKPRRREIRSSFAREEGDVEVAPVRGKKVVDGGAKAVKENEKHRHGEARLVKHITPRPPRERRSKDPVLAEQQLGVFT